MGLSPTCRTKREPGMIGFIITIIAVLLMIIGAWPYLTRGYGIAGSLEELENEVTGSDEYRTELESYIALHNITIGLNRDDGRFAGFAEGAMWVPIKDMKDMKFETNQYELIVTKHMQKCETVSKGSIVGIPPVFSNVLMQGVC